MSFPDSNLAPAYEMDSLESTHHHAAFPNIKVDKKDYAVGIVYLLTVILLWTIANFITQVSLTTARMSSNYNPFSSAPVCQWIRKTILVPLLQYSCVHMIHCIPRITYLTTSAFSFYLVLYCIRHVWSRYRSDSSG